MQHCIAFVKNLGKSESGWLQSDRKFDVKCALWKQTVQQIFSNTKLTLHSLGDTVLNFDLEHKETRSRVIIRVLTAQERQQNCFQSIL